MQLYTAPDIIGANAAVPIIGANWPAGNPKKARMIMWCSQGGQAAVGDSNVGAARGAHLTAAAQIVWPESKDLTQTYDLTLMYAYVPTGTQLTMTFLL